MRVSGALGKRLSTGTVAFGLAPRINAAGRMEQARMAVELLTTRDPAHAENLAEQLDRNNKRRQEIEHSIVAQAREMVDALGDPTALGAVVVGHPEWHPGVIGIVASRLAEVYHRPSIVVALGEELAQGSARSVAGFDLYQALASCSEGLLQFGGHKAAAGLKLTPSAFPEFSRRFDDHCRGALTPEHRQRALDIDAEVHLAELSPLAVEWIEALEPYGLGNPRPVLAASELRVAGDPRFVGERKNHVQLRLNQGHTTLKAVGWNMADRLRHVASGTICSAAFVPSINEWNGRREVQLEIRDLKVAADTPSQARSA
jgi:single-stranded-DNA-specific exonuclease